MFQTELIEFLQRSCPDWLAAFWVFISRMGYSSFYIPILIVITFGLDFRKGFLLTQMMLWVGILTDVLKTLFALPRPSDVDAGVRLLAGDAPNATPFVDKGASGFWALPDRETVATIRAQPEWSFGLPSGHVSGTTTFWGGLSLLFRPAVIKVAALAMIVLMPLSRMYLGRHFLADVLGGLLLGVALLATARFLFMTSATHGRLLELTRLHLRLDARSLIVVLFLLVAPFVLLMFDRLLEPEDVGRLLGLNIAFVALAVMGLPDDAGSLLKRAGRVVLAFALYAIAARLVGMVIEASPADEDSPWIAFLAGALPAFLALWGGVTASLGLRLYARRVEAEAAPA